MTKSTEAQDRFERIIRQHADMSEPQRAIAGRDPHSKQLSQPLDSGRLRQVAEEFRTTFSTSELAALESWDDEYMNVIAVAIGHGFPLRRAETSRLAKAAQGELAPIVTDCVQRTQDPETHTPSRP